MIALRSTTEDGEVADRTKYSINEDAIREEEKFDGLYAMMYSFQETETSDVLSTARDRWEIKESFRITKTGMRAKLIYLFRKDHIIAQMLIIFIAPLFYRILEQNLERRYTAPQIIECLSDMNTARNSSKDSYHPACTRTDLTYDIHKYLGFHTDYERMNDWRMRGNCHITKST